MYRRLFIFIEGNDDERFFEKILVPKLQGKYKYVKHIKYAQKPKKFEYIANFINSVKSIGADYIYVADIDNFPCVTAKKQKIQGKVKNLDADRIMIVVKEIEGWYLAGISDTACKKFKIRTVRNTNNITKEQFDMLIPRKFDSRIDFMAEILKIFSVELAKRKNKSFEYFIKKYG